MSLQFRYLEDIVSPAFKAAVESRNINGSTAYLAYLDNRDKLKQPSFVLLREAKIESCEIRGSAYIVKLKVARYFQQRGSNLDQMVERLADDKLPGWLSDGRYEGFWAISLKQPLDVEKLVQHDFAHAGHLKAFESTVDNLALHTDFLADERKLLVNIIDVRDRQNKSRAGKALSAGGDYQIILYHYWREPDPHATRKSYWLKAWSNNRNVTVSSESSLKLESEYDEDVFSFSLDAEMGAEKTAIELRLVPEHEENHPVLRIHFPFEVLPKVWDRWMRVIVMTAGLSAAQGALLFATDKLKLDTQTFVVLGFVIATSLLVAVSSIFKGFKRMP